VLEFGGTSLEAGTTIVTQEPDLGLWGRFINLLAIILVSLDNWLRSIGIPYSFGFAIILFTILVRLATFPLNVQQIKSSKAMQELQPKMKELQEKYKGDREKLAQEQMKLYKEHGVNPLGGCLPMLVQMPIWFALYRSLLQLSQEGLLNEGFFWIPSLAGPVSSYNQGLSWLYPFVNGAPPIGWADAIAYLILPILLVVSQLYMQQMMTPPTSDPQQASMQSIMKFMPLMFGYFALVVPSGLSLYWFTSNLLAMAQQYFTRTNVEQTPAPAGAAAGNSPSISATPAMTDAEEKKKEKDVKSKRRKSRRKR
jgi:YidC/Oxa1 family membrane protein insertase